MALFGKMRAPYIVIHKADAREAAQVNQETRAYAEARGQTLPADARPYRTLREWRKLLAAHDGGLHDPLTGVKRTIPLKALQGADPDKTWLRISFAGGNVPFEPNAYSVHGEVLLVHGPGPRTSTVQ